MMGGGGVRGVVKCSLGCEKRVRIPFLSVFQKMKINFVFYFSEAVCVQSAGMHETLHGSKFAEKAREDRARSGLLHVQKAQR